MSYKALFLAAGVLSAASSMANGFSAGQGFAACKDNFYQGFVPRVNQALPGKLRDICFSGFAVLHSGQSKTPVYVAEHLTPARLADAKDEERTNRFYEEARLPSAERATLADYKGSGYDRGHMAPAADMPSPNAMAQSFSLANMVPQSPENNRGVWAKKVEAATRKYVERGNEVYVITGPLYRGQVKAIGPGQVWVPAALFKLVYDPSKKKAWAYLVENVDSPRSVAPISYAELVNQTGTHYLPAGALAP